MCESILCFWHRLIPSAPLNDFTGIIGSRMRNVKHTVYHVSTVEQTTRFKNAVVFVCAKIPLALDS